MIVKLAVRLEHEGFMEEGEKETVQHNICLYQTLIATKLGATREEIEDSVKFSEELIRHNLEDETNNHKETDYEKI